MDERVIIEGLVDLVESWISVIFAKMGVVWEKLPPSLELAKGYLEGSRQLALEAEKTPTNNRSDGICFSVNEVIDAMRRAGITIDGRTLVCDELNKLRTCG